MTIEQMRARLGEIVNSLNTISAKETLTEADISEVEKLKNEYNTLSNSIKVKEDIANITTNAQASQRQAPAAAPAPARVEIVDQTPKHGFKSFGDFLNAVKNSSVGNVDKRFQNALYEKHGEEGGYLVPEEMLSEIKKKIEGDESLLAKTTQIKVAGNSLSFPVDESAPWNGGVEVYWVGEGRQVQEGAKGKLGLASLKLHKIAALVKVTDELLEDSTALESYIKAKAPTAITSKLNGAIISGDGVAKPFGILKSGFRVTVAKESGQAADTIVARNVLKMDARLIPGSKAAWYVNAGCIEQLRVMKDDAGNFIYIAPGSQLNQTPYGMLLGKPVIPMIGSMPALGDEGDIVLADLSYYHSIVKAGGLQQAVSQHLYFDQNAQAFRFTMRVDGNCPFKSPVKTEYGDYEMSGIITLATRA